MAARFSPYISFPGNAADAFPYYRDLFGGRLEVMTYAQFPSMEGFPFTPPPEAVAHATMESPSITLTGGDGMGDGLPPLRSDVYSFLLSFDTTEEATGFIDKVTSTGGEVAMPLAGCLSPSRSSSSLNFSRSSATSIISGLVPMIFTPAFSRALARFNGV